VTLRKGEVRAIRGSTQLLLYALFLLERHFGLQLMWLRSCQPKEVATIALPLDAEAAAEAAVDGRIGLSAHLQACLLSFSLSPVPCAAASAPPSPPTHPPHPPTPPAARDAPPGGRGAAAPSV
jgi:hypothetical protein